MYNAANNYKYDGGSKKEITHYTITHMIDYPLFRIEVKGSRKHIEDNINRIS